MLWGQNPSTSLPPRLTPLNLTHVWKGVAIIQKTKAVSDSTATFSLHFFPLISLFFYINIKDY